MKMKPGPVELYIDELSLPQAAPADRSFVERALVAELRHKLGTAAVAPTGLAALAKHITSAAYGEPPDRSGQSLRGRR